MEHLRFELESQQELAEYHRMRAEKAERIIAFITGEQSRNGNHGLNQLTGEYSSRNSRTDEHENPERTRVSSDKFKSFEKLKDTQLRQRVFGVTNSSHEANDDYQEGFFSKRMSGRK